MGDVANEDRRWDAAKAAFLKDSSADMIMTSFDVCCIAFDSFFETVWQQRRQ